MHRFYCPIQDASGDKIIISDKNQVHHLKDVLRLKLKDEIIVFDDKGNEYIAQIEELLPKGVIVKIKETLQSTPDAEIKITVACAIPKKSRMDDIIDSLTQLGADRIIPLETKRVVVKLDKDKKTSRYQRWKKIALNASQQSQRNTLPIIDPVRGIKELLSEPQDFDLKLIPTLMAGRKSLKEVLGASKPKNILILIGPEGDFSLQEINLAIDAGCIPVSLGDLVLRVETAAIAIVSFIRLYQTI